MAVEGWSKVTAETDTRVAAAGLLHETVGTTEMYHTYGTQKIETLYLT